jgi:hypothetical protein
MEAGSCRAVPDAGLGPLNRDPMLVPFSPHPPHIFPSSHDSVHTGDAAPLPLQMSPKFAGQLTIQMDLQRCHGQAPDASLVRSIIGCGMSMVSLDMSHVRWQLMS